jgi:hypothetical protein
MLIFLEQTGLWFLEKQVLMELPKVVLIIAYRGQHQKGKQNKISKKKREEE